MHIKYLTCRAQMILEITGQRRERNDRKVSIKYLLLQWPQLEKKEDRRDFSAEKKL